MKTIETLLSDFGLTENEVKVYIVSLEETDLSPNKISKITGIPRTTVYDVLMGLSLKGLVELEQSDGFTKQQTRVKAKNPSELRSIINKKRKALDALELDTIYALPSLKEKYHGEKANADFQFYPGIEGARKIFEPYRLNSETPISSWTYLMPMDAFGKKWTNEIIDTDIEKWNNRKHPNRELIPLTDWTKHVLSYQLGRNPGYLLTQEIRYIDNPIFEMFVELELHGEYVRAACADEDEVWGMVIKSKSLSKSFKAMYDFMWNIASPITEELVRSWGDNGILEEEMGRKSRNN